MSSIGQAVGGIVGGTIGFLVGGPTGAYYGAQAGMMIGGAIDPPKGSTINGPRLNDLSVQTSTYGAFIPRDYGTVAQTGNVFWLKGDALTEVKTTTTSGGKGGPQTTTNTFSYYATFAVGLCKGPIDGVRRIWIGSDLYYDAGSSDLATIIASNQNATTFTLYLGTDTQNPDPLIQADKGAANVPAYRGLAYIVFDSLPLEKYSNSLVAAQVKVEVVRNGTFSGTYQTQSLPASGYWQNIAASADRVVLMPEDSTYSYSLTGVGLGDWITHSTPLHNCLRLRYINNQFVAIGKRLSVNVILYSDDGESWSTTTPPTDAKYLTDITYGDSTYVAVAYYDSPSLTGPTNLIFAGYSLDALGTYTLPETTNWRGIAELNGTFLAVSLSSNGAISTDRGGSWTAVTLPADTNRVQVYAHKGYFVVLGDAYLALSIDGITWSTKAAPSHSAIEFCVDESRIWISRSSYVSYSDDLGDTWTSIYVGVFLVNLALYNGVLYATQNGNTGTVYIVPPNLLSDSAQQLSEIVQAECLVSNLLTTGDLDVTDLTDSVRGYRVSQLGAIRSGLDPLRAAWPFDVRQHGYQIQFVRRGGASVATIPAADLDARAAGAAPGVAIADVREMDLVLPCTVSVKYLDATREYDINEQIESRANTDAVGHTAVDLPIVMTAAEAKQATVALLYLYWMERYDISFVLPPSYQHLEPGDVVEIDATNATYNLRLTSVTWLPDGRVECRAKYNSAALYTQVAVADEGQSTGATLGLAGPCVYELLDIPLMRDDDDTAGFPVAMSGYLTGWPGGVLYRSDDSGQTWSDLTGVTSPGAVIGYATGTLAAHGGTVIDFASTLAVKLYSGSLASVTQAQMFAGQNWFAYGAHGRWEIIAAQNCVLQGDGSYVLSDFLRGQNGTEWATGLHAAYDRLVLLDAAVLAFISVNASTIGATRGYRAITTGKAIDSDATQDFAYAGVNLECLSPVHLTGNRNPGTNDWTLTWVRRGRTDSWRDYVDLPLGETTEAYEVDIFTDGTYATVKRTLSSLTSATAAYTSAQQVTDFGGNQATLYLKVYQLSATVGRGYALTQSLTR